MNNTYYSGLPCSDFNELQHYGITGMKWGVRRFQNKDGTRTEAGKLRYRNGETNERLERAKAIIKSVGSNTGKAAKTATNKLIKAIKKRHPSLMTDEELIAYRNRLQLEKSVKDARRELRKNDFGTKTWQAIQDIAASGTKRLVEKTAENAASALAERLMESNDDRDARKLASRSRKQLALDTTAIADKTDKANKKRNEISEIDEKLEKRSLTYEERDELTKRKEKLNNDIRKLDREVDSRLKNLENRKRVMSMVGKNKGDGGGNNNDGGNQKKQDKQKQKQKQDDDEKSRRDDEPRRLSATEIVDKMNRDREKARLEANRQEAERKAEAESERKRYEKWLRDHSS